MNFGSWSFRFRVTQVSIHPDFAGHKLQFRFRFLDPSPSQMQASKEHLRHIWSCSNMLCSLGKSDLKVVGLLQTSTDTLEYFRKMALCMMSGKILEYQSLLGRLTIYEDYN
ncbi:hypothetical protein L1987_72139 [Smallanthus sonchifolius]|uniref:Uncharacterized protein n=1 Tax=Smallanthus sonchifolius TaxID=185202 RepID=A0ACB9AYS1_9ASTR|nr:hypothetical protein L1987_72139 [Smallanthus sonchifolius]